METLTPKNNEIKRILAEIASDWQESISSEDKEEQLKFLSNIERNLSKLKTILEERNLFWSDNKKWIEVICWTLFGTLLYLIQQTAEYNLKIRNGTNQSQTKNQQPINHKLK